MPRAHATRAAQGLGAPLRSAGTYWRVTGWALATLGVVGFVVTLFLGPGAGAAGFLEFDWPHNLLHVALGVLHLGVGYGGVAPRFARPGAVAAGIAYLLAAAAGLAAPGLFAFLGVHLELGENLFHLLLGAWGVATGATP